MKTLEDIVADVEEIGLRSGDLGTSIEAVTKDSRAVEQGALFVAVSGRQFDGHDFIDAAVEAGASAILVDQEYDRPAGVPILEAEDTRRVLGSLGRCCYDDPSRELTVIGITGTNGKTSTSYLMQAIFDKTRTISGLIGTIEYQWPGRRITAANTTPDGLVLHQTLRQMADDGVEVAILEVSSHGLANARVEGVAFDAGIFTNLSHDHVEFHGSMEAYRRAKWRLFEQYLPASADHTGAAPLAVINVGNREGRRLVQTLAARNDLEVVSYGLAQTAAIADVDHFRGADLRLALDHLSVGIVEPDGERYELESCLPGRFNAENMLGAYACARRLGVSAKKARQGLAEAAGVPGRMQRVGNRGQGPAVFVDYAHSPDALEKVLATLRPVTEGRLWVVFGCGGDRDKKKRAPMGAVAARLADCAVVTSDNPRSEDPDAIIDAVVEGLKGEDDDDEAKAPIRWWRNVDREEAIFDAILRARPEDVILVAGKGHETTQEQSGRRREFDDRVVASRALRRRGDESWGS